MKKHAVIIGGGMMGLTAAYLLSKRGWKTTVLEKSEKLGGIISSSCVNGAWVEDCYHNLFKSYSRLLPLIRELGLEDKIVWKPAPTAFYADGKLFAVNAPWHIFRFPTLSFWEKVKLAKLLVEIQFFIKDSLAYDDMTAREYVTRKCGRRVYEKFFKILINGKFDGHADRVSASWLIARQKLRNERSLQGEVMGYFAGKGFKNLVDALTVRVKKGGRIITNAPVKKILVQNNTAQGVMLADGKKIFGDAVISTVPPSALAKLADFPPCFAKQVRLPMQGAVCVLLGLNKRLTNEHYWTNIMDECVFRAVVEQTNWAPPEQYKGQHFVYLASYPHKASPVWRMTDKQVVNTYFKDLRRLYPSISAKNVKYAHVYANPATTMLMLTGTGRKMTQAGYKTPVKNLFMSSALNCYPETLLDRCVKAAEECVSLVTKERERR